jgi:hypothetical protein
MNRVMVVLIVLVSTTLASGDRPRKFDEIPASPWSDVMARLDNVAINFQRAPSNRLLYLISYSGQRSCVGDADRLNLRAKTYLVKRGVTSERIVLMDGGYLDKSRIDVWMWPSNVFPPAAVPNIDRKLVRVKNCTRRSTARR